MLRVLHTSDWHLGHRLHELARDFEHQAFLAWLTDTLESEQVDALLVAGDVFDAANPPSSALAAWYRFLAQAAVRVPGLTVVVVGGNHDSAARLDAPREVLSALRVHVVGGLPRRADRSVDTALTSVPLLGRDGRVQAWVAAVPYLRATDLPTTADLNDDALVEGTRRLYAECLDAARARREPFQALITTGHCLLVGGQTSERSERKILLGNQHPLPMDIFGEDVTYAALGHLHLAQRVGGKEHLRYSGSPLPLSLAEARYPHQVLLLDLADGVLEAVRAIAVPRAVPLLRIPEEGAAPLPEVLAAIDALPRRQCGVPQGHPSLPYLEVQVWIERPEPGLRVELEARLADRAARLVRMGVSQPGDQAVEAGRAGRAPTEALADLVPEEVFRRLWRLRFPDTDPTPELLGAFHEMVEAASQDPRDAVLSAVHAAARSAIESKERPSPEVSSPKNKPRRGRRGAET